MTAYEAISDWKRQELSFRISALEEFIPDDIFSEEITNIFRKALSQLPEQTRKVFIMSRFQDKSNKNIAEELNISVKGVEYHISKALRSLKISLKDYLPLLLFFIEHN
jgi:RNA polymerase sigma-70 factor (ECF subfamily)